jgi:hypothetical protein
METVAEKIDYLIEANTSEATNVEMSICYHYNLLKGDNEVEAQKTAGINDKNFAKLTPAILKIGEVVAKGMKSKGYGSKLIHSGASKGGSNKYLGGSDTTPKADFYSSSSKENRISLKKGGGGKGAQLMSAKSAEAAGVFHAAVGHYERNDGAKTLSQSAEFIAALDILQNKMLATARTDMVVQAGTSKKEFGIWYSTESSRFHKLMSVVKDAKQVTKHLKAELSVVGAAQKHDKKHYEKLPTEEDLTKAGLKRIERGNKLTQYRKEFEENSDIQLGDVQVSARHLENVEADKLTSAAVKRQVSDIIQKSIDGTAWKIELQKFFNNNDGLKKWMVYEAGSGLYKFTGQYSNGKPYTGGNTAVANKIVVWSPNGFKYEHGMMKYAMANPQLCNKIDVTFKATGKRTYHALRIASEVEHNLPMLQEELKNIESEFLAEGFIGDMKKKFTNFLEKVKNAIWNFIKRLIERVIGNIKVLANKGITAFNEAMGLDMHGRVGMKTPSW